MKQFGATIALSIMVLSPMFSPVANAQIHGVDAQVNEGKAVPTVVQLQALLNPNDIVRDVLGWHQVDPNCNLRTDPSLPIVISSKMNLLYGNVSTAQGQNFVTLAFNNTHCGQISNSGAKTFPDTDALRAEFAAYAVRVVEQIPALAGLSIWNELNGTWNGGYSTEADALKHYCALANVVIAAVRQVNPNIPIAIGATVGSNIDGWFIALFDTYGCMGKGDPTIWLDVHPYLNTDSDWSRWQTSIANIRADNITNPLAATEWGATAAYNWSVAHPSGDYMETFDAKVVAQDPAWAALSWFAWKSTKKMPNSGLFDLTGMNFTALGSDYVAEYKH